MIYYIYNGDELLGFIYNSNTYYYHKNIFGDIIGILDSNYNEVVTYTYNSWGLLTNKTDTTTINLSTINPFRYRSYYYDEETNLYYLNSRYYNPEWGRFVNGDGVIGSNGDAISQNLFAYTSNNFINYSDNNGYGLISALKKVVSTVKKIVKKISNKIINVKATNNAKICTYKISSTKSSAKVCEVNISASSNINESKNNKKMPTTNEPNSRWTLPGGNTRVFGDDGRWVKDLDYDHPTHWPSLDNPHVHDVEWKGNIPNRSKNPRNLLPNEEDNVMSLPDVKNIVGVVGVAGVGYLIYRGVRMLPSLTPWTWWTIPANLATP